MSPADPVTVLAPCAGRPRPLSEAPDPVFAQEMVGPGVLIEPDDGPTEVVAPIAGRLVKVHPHAFVVLSPEGVGVLVHLGINTVRLEGKGFEVLAQEGDEVHAGDRIVRWDPSTIEGEDLSTVVPVVLMDRPAGSVSAPSVEHVAAGDRLFEI